MNPTEQDPRLTRAAQLRADAEVMRKAAKVRQTHTWLNHASGCIGDADRLESYAADLEKEVQAEIDAKAAEPVDEWAEVKRVVDHILSNRSQCLSSEICVAKYVSHLQGRVAELENDECERINNRIAALDAEIAGLRAENERLKGEAAKYESTQDNRCDLDPWLDHFEIDGMYLTYKSRDYAKAAVHYRRKFREAEAKLNAVPKLWMARNRRDGEIVVDCEGLPLLYLSEKEAANPPCNWEAVPYDGRKGVAQ